MVRTMSTEKKLDAEDVTAIHYSNKVAGDTQEELARRYGVSEATISRYVRQIESEIEAMQTTGREYYDARMEAYEAFKRTY